MLPFATSLGTLQHALDSAHIDGLAVLFIHQNLGLECVILAFAKYIACVKDNMNPCKAYVDTTWITLNDRK